LTAATFTDSAGGADPSDYAVTATLFDGSVIPATVTANGDGSFNINIDHTWTAAWDQWLTLSVDDHTDTWPISQTGYITAYNQEPTGATGVNVATDTSQIFTGTVAQFAGLPTDLSAYTASIDWGDGNSDRFVPLTAGADGLADLIGSHVYTEPGNYTITATLQGNTNGWIQNGKIDNSPVNPQTSSTAIVTGNHRLPQSGTGENFSIDTGETYSGVIAHYSDVDLNSLADYSATIEWGDGSQTTGTITTNAQGGIDVAGSHQYTYAGSYGVTVALADSYSGWNDPTGQLIVPQPVAGANATVTGTPNPSPPPIATPVGGSVYLPVDAPGTLLATQYAVTVAGSLVAAGTPMLADVNAHPGSQSLQGIANRRVNATLGVVQNFAAPKKLSDLTGVISWGDGSTSLASFRRVGKDRLAVRGSHVYASAKSFNVSVDIYQAFYENGKVATDEIIGLPSLTANATVAAPARHRAVIGSEPTFSAKAGETFTGTLARVELSALADGTTRTVIIDWGDGTLSDGTLTADGSKFDISATHVYPEHGNYKIAIYVSDQAGGKSKPAASVSATVSVLK
jgi:hypothetical protein